MLKAQAQAPGSGLLPPQAEPWAQPGTSLITRDHRHQIIWINQQVYIENMLKRFGLQDANNTKTLLPASFHLEKSEDLATTETKTYYQQMIGTLIYAAIRTRPDIAFTATCLSQYV